MNIKKKIKLAACIEKGDLFKPVKDWNLIIANKTQCEINEKYPQVIPYVILKNQNTSEYFQYTKAKVGKKNRLHNQVSVGVGGHIESLPKGDILDHISNEAARNICEKIGYDRYQHYLGNNHLEYEILKQLVSEDYLVINTIDSSDQFNRVHVGICMVINVNPNRLTAFEDGIILEPKWVNRDELKTKVFDETSRLDLWSRIALQWIFGVNTDFGVI